jgi:hypothetical protein
LTPATTHRDRPARTCIANGRSFKHGLPCNRYGKRLVAKARRRAGRNDIARRVMDVG